VILASRNKQRAAAALEDDQEDRETSRGSPAIVAKGKDVEKPLRPRSGRSMAVSDYAFNNGGSGGFLSDRWASGDEDRLAQDDGRAISPSAFLPACATRSR